MIDKFKLMKLELEYSNMLTEEKFLARTYQEKAFVDDHIYFSNRVFKWLWSKILEEN